MFLRFFLTIHIILLSKILFGQTGITGYVLESEKKKEGALPGVTVSVLNGQSAVFSDSVGYFNLPFEGNLPVQVTFQFPGFNSDTIEVTSLNPLRIILKKSVDLKEVEISAKQEALVVSTINPLNTEKITERELLKAACCNLSEAFETNPSVTVSYKDAVTGVKEISLLGLRGIYVQMLSEVVPDMRGLAGIYGLTYIPGPWIKSIQLTKGSGAVLNGYESTTGQINIEYKKPFDKDEPRLFLNLFGDELGGVEANAIYKHRFNEAWSSNLMVHGRTMSMELDRNDDGFMDIPENKQINLYNRWQYTSNKKLEAQLMFKFLADEINGGQTGDVTTTPLYTTNVKTIRAQAGGKLGIVFPERPGKSIGNIFQATYHDMESMFGVKSYNASEKSIYIQSMYQDYLWQKNQLLTAGVSYRYNLLKQEFYGLPEKIEEHIPGIFAEYTYSYIDKFTVILGLREDLQQNKEWVFIPRLHGKYNFTENAIFRFSAGKSYRNPYLIADNISVLASSRVLDFREDINPERAWNYGVNFTGKFKLNQREGSIIFDAYRTDFIDQLVVDEYSDSTVISFYNLDGSSYSNSFQLTFNIELINYLDLRLAYKIEDVRATYNGSLEEKPLVSNDRVLATTSFMTENKHWKFDLTYVWEGRKKLQNTYVDEQNKGKEYSPSFGVMNFQVTKVFRKFELYGGAENIFDFRQLNPIINPENPFGNSFDATNIWGPIQGRRIYAGIRMSIY
jgi:hypothetical protein